MSVTTPAFEDFAPERRGRTTPGGQFALLVVGEIGLMVAALVGFNWWTHGRFVQTTNDAYLQADQVTVAPKVQGYVQQVFVHDNQAVAPGQPLVRIDGASYDAALAHEAAALDARRADISTSERQVAQGLAAVARAEADLAGARAEALYAAGEARRYAKLSAEGVETRERAGEVREQAVRAADAVRSDEAAVRQAEGQVATLKAQGGQARAQRDAAEAQLRAARLNLGDTVIRASVAGAVGDRTVRVGQFVQPGARLMTVVPVQDVYLVANFKETQIGRIRVGQTADVRIDALGGQPVAATVDSFAPGTGAQFALLPPENATGNFTKVVQRVPVRLRLHPAADQRDHLLPGLSATVSIDTAQPPAAPVRVARS